MPPDLNVPMFISSNEAISGGARTLRFSRSIQDRPSQDPAKAGKMQREKVEIEVSWPPRCCEGHRILLENAGDRHVNRCGDVVVIIHISNKP